jgi:hypothetical protein
VVQPITSSSQEVKVLWRKRWWILRNKCSTSKSTLRRAAPKGAFSASLVRQKDAPRASVAGGGSRGEPPYCPADLRWSGSPGMPYGVRERGPETAATAEGADEWRA